MRKHETKRIEEMIESFEACRKETYHKSEILPELTKLESEMAAILFSEENNSAHNKPKLWDIERKLDELSAANRGAGRKEIDAFKKSSRIINNMIRAEISGNKGEEITYRKLAAAGYGNTIVKNLEVKRDDFRTEIDEVVLTPKGAFIIEVKNTRSDVFIDETGEAFSIGRFTHHDYNLKRKMDARCDYLIETLEGFGYPETAVHGIVVYTNGRIKIENHCKSLNVSFLNRLPYIIKSTRGESIFTETDIERMRIALEEISAREAYPLKVNIQEFKRQFASAVIAASKPKSKIAMIKEAFSSFFKNGINQLAASQAGNANIPVNA